MKLHYNVIKRLIDDYFTETVPKLNEDNTPIFELITLSSDELINNNHYSIKSIDTKDREKLTEFASNKLQEYLNPKPIYKEGKAPLSLSLSQISKANAINKQLRTPEMFFELEINQAKEYQTYFPEYRLNAEHLKYHSKLEDWIKCLESQRIALQPQDGKGESKLTLEQIFDNNKNGHSICLELFKELEIIDSVKGNCILNKKSGNVLLGLIVGLKESSQNLLNRKYTDGQLLNVFQAYLKTNFISIARRGKGYTQTRKETIDLINRKVKIAPAI